MAELMTESLAQVQQKQKMGTRTAVGHIAALTIVAVTALLTTLGGAVLYAQGQDKGKDKYSLKSPGGIAFSDFRGYEDWSVVSSARTEDALPEEILKVIVGNPAMIKAYKAGVPQKPLRLRIRVPYAREGEGLHLPPLPEALSRVRMNQPDAKLRCVMIERRSFFSETRLCLWNFFRGGNLATAPATRCPFAAASEEAG